MLTVSAERERSGELKQDGFYRYERRVGSFTRTISLPEGVTDDSISASYANGVLEVRVQKPEETKPRRIERWKEHRCHTSVWLRFPYDRGTATEA